MITKIITGGQTGAGQAALDVAIEFDIPHGGWIPKGRMTENGPLPDKYQLKEMPTENYADRTEKNILDAYATVIISHGELTGGSALTLKLATKYLKRWMHVGLNLLHGFKAAFAIKSWCMILYFQIGNLLQNTLACTQGVFCPPVKTISDKIDGSILNFLLAPFKDLCYKPVTTERRGNTMDSTTVLIKALANGLKVMAAELDKMAGKIEKQEAKAKRKIKPKVKSKAKPAKKSAPKAPKKGTATGAVYTIISGSKSGVDTNTLKKKTGLSNQQIFNILNQLKRQDKVKNLKRGVYGKA
jgi:hypothetical protein